MNHPYVDLASAWRPSFIENIMRNMSASSSVVSKTQKFCFWNKNGDNGGVMWGSLVTVYKDRWSNRKIACINYSKHKNVKKYGSYCGAHMIVRNNNQSL